MARTVILIDDDDDDLDVMREAIRRMDPRALCSSFIHAEEALRRLSSDSVLIPDYIFIDINMPKKNGIECLIELRKIEALKNIPIIMVSTSMTDGVSNMLKRNGASLTFQKPSYLEGYHAMLKQVFR
jgi:CheY-like chemotaxis protein